MRIYAPIIVLLYLAFMPSCGPEITIGGGSSSSGGTAEDKTFLLEGEWTLTITDSTGEYENLIDFSETGEILHWYDQYGNDFYGDLSAGYSNVSVSSTNLVLLDLQYDYMFNGIQYSSEMSLSGLMLSNDNIMQLSGSTQFLENGVFVNEELLDVYATRGNDTGSGGFNDGANTSLLEGTWYLTMTDLIETGIHSIEFNQTGTMLNWVTPYGVNIPRLDPASDLQAYVSSSYSVDLAGQYTFEDEGSTFSVSLEFSGDMATTTESTISLDGIVKVYSEGYLISLLHSTAEANRSTVSGANDNANFAFLEGEWVFVTNHELGSRWNYMTCHANGEILEWVLSDGADVFNLDPEASAVANISSDNQARTEMNYELESIGGFMVSYYAIANGVFNSDNNNFMQMVGTEVYELEFETLSFPIFLSAFKTSLLETSVNNEVWPVKAIAAQRDNMGYGPLHSPWVRN